MEHSEAQTISLSQLARDLGMQLSWNDSILTGIELKKRYMAKHGRVPPRSKTVCDGRVIMVNSYTEEDRPLVEQVLRWHADGRV
jgi:hypothetical protein